MALRSHYTIDQIFALIFKTYDLHSYVEYAPMNDCYYVAINGFDGRWRTNWFRQPSNEELKWFAYDCIWSINMEYSE